MKFRVGVGNKIKVAAIAKALAWHQTISKLEGSLREKYVGIVPELMREFLYCEKKLSE